MINHVDNDVDRLKLLPPQWCSQVPPSEKERDRMKKRGG